MKDLGWVEGVQKQKEIDLVSLVSVSLDGFVFCLIFVHQNTAEAEMRS